MTSLWFRHGRQNLSPEVWAGLPKLCTAGFKQIDTSLHGSLCEHTEKDIAVEIERSPTGDVFPLPIARLAAAEEFGKKSKSTGPIFPSFVQACKLRKEEISLGCLNMCIYGTAEKNSGIMHKQLEHKLEPIITKTCGPAVAMAHVYLSLTIETIRHQHQEFKGRGGAWDQAFFLRGKEL